MPKTQRDHDRVGQVILFKRPESPFWYVKYPKGIRELKTGKNAGKIKRRYHTESTGQTELRQAKLMAQDIDLKLFKGQMGVCTGQITVAELRKAFIEYQEKDTDNRFWHLRDLRGRTAVFEKWATTKGLTVASQINREIAELFVRYLRHERRQQDGSATLGAEASPRPTWPVDAQG